MNLVALTALAISIASASPNLAEQPALNPEIKKVTLKNGLTVYVLPHQQPQKRAQLWLAVNAGSILEDDDQRGLAHLVEHMAFNGTKRFPKQAVVDFMEKSGMQFGADVNAYTDFDQTVYMLTVPTDDKKAVGTGLDILRDWAGDIAFEPAEVEKERGVVMEEWRLGRGAWMRLYDKSATTLFKGSRYADRLTIGLPEIIQKAPRDTLVRFYKDWYRPDLMSVIAVGDFDAKDLEKQITDRFNDLPASPATARPHFEAPVPRDHPMLVSAETDAEMPMTSVSIFEKLPHRPMVSVGDMRRSLVEELYNAMLTARLDQLAQKPGSPFLGARSGADHLGRTADAYVRNGEAKAGHAADALKGILNETARVKKLGFSATELEREKKNSLRFIQRAAKEDSKTDSRDLADELTRNFFTHELVPGRAIEAKLTEQLLPTITLEEVNKLATSKRAGGRVILVQGPATDKLPSRDDVLKMALDADKGDATAYVDAPTVTTLMPNLPKPGKVTATKKTAAVGVTEWTLANGVKVVVKPTDFQNDTVKIEGFSSGGTSVVSDADFNNARFAAQYVNESGAGEFDKATLERALAGKVVHATTFITELEQWVSAGGSPDDLETILQLVHLRMTAPHRDDDAFTAWKARTRDWIEHKTVMPEVSFFEQMNAFVSSQHMRRQPQTVKDVDAVDLDKALAVYKERFSDASGFTFIIVGNVDDKKLQPLVEQYLGSLPSTGKKQTWKDIGAEFPKGDKEMNVSQGIEPKSFVFFARHAMQKWDKDQERDLKMLQMLLDIRLREVLREDMSGVYGVQVWAYADRRPREERTVGVFFGCDPKNVGKLKDAVVATTKAVEKDGLGELYLTKVKEQITRAHETDLRDNEWWSNQLEDAWRYGDDPTKIPDVKPMLARINADNVKAAAKKYLSGGDTVLAILKPAEPNN